MNISTLNEFIEQFESDIIESGFKRDIQDYSGSLSSNQNNIVILREIANKISAVLNSIYGSDLPDNLNNLLPDKVIPFTKTAFHDNLQNLINDKVINQADFYQRLNQIIGQINKQIQSNFIEIDKIKQFILPYLNSQKEILDNNEKAIVSIIFKEEKTISNLKIFTKNLQVWNKTLPIYHQLLSSSSPEDIEIVNVQNGSIDFLINLDVNIAINLADIFEVGFKAFLTYLSYKKMLKPIVDGYLGNKKLIDSENEREKELINNIGEAIRAKLTEQHENALILDKSIDKNSDKKILEITKLISSHILKGNDFKLLVLPENVKSKTEGKTESQVQELKKISSQVKMEMKSLPSSEIKKLLAKYKEPEEVDGN